MTPEVRPVGALMRTLMTLMGFVLLAGTADAACNTPTGAAGDMTYSTSANVMAYCDGTNWISMAGGVSLTVNTSGGGADNLGNHTATQDLNMSGYSVNSGLDATFTGLGNFGSLLAGGLTVTGEASITTISTTLIQVGSGGGASCSSNINGALRYNSTSSTLEICTGTTWTGLASGTITGSGVSGGSATAIAFWNGPSTLTYDSGLYWDNTNKRLGISNTTPSATVQVDATPNTRAFYVNGSGLGQSGGFGIFGSGPQLTGIGWRNHLIGNNLYLPASTNIPTVDGANASYTKAYAISFASEDSTDTGLTFWTGSGAGTPMTAKMRLTNAGNLGLGTITPIATLQVSGTFVVSQTNQNSLASASLAVDSRGVSVSSIIHINGSPGTAMGAGSNQIVSGTSNVTVYSAGSVTIATNGTQRMVVNNSGRVGIGTTAPDASLNVSSSLGTAIHAYGDGGAPNLLLDSAPGANFVFTRFSKGGSPRWDLGASNTADSSTATGSDFYIARFDNTGAYIDTPVIMTRSNGYLGLGTWPGFTLDVSGSFRMSNPSNNAVVAVQYSGASGRQYQLISCKACGATGVGGLVVYDGTALADRAYIAAGVNGWQTPSDRRLKKDIDTLSVLDKLGPVRGVSYKLRDSGKPQIGVIAQEIAQSFPLAVTGKNDGAKFLGVSYDAIAAIALEGVKELKALFDSDHAEVAKLKAANDNLEQRVEILEMELRRVKPPSR